MADLRATQRNSILGLLADALSPVADYLTTSTNPIANTGTDFSLAGLLGESVRPAAVTADRLSYGEPLTTGKGFARQMKPETRDLVLGAIPVGKPAATAVTKGAKFAGRELSPQAEKMLMDFMRQQGGIKDIIENRQISAFDPRFDPRKKEADRLASLRTTVDTRISAPSQVSLADFEGKPFITSMSDRTDAGAMLQGINDVTLDRPVNLRGGQGFMFDDPDLVWASAKGPTKQIQKMAQELYKQTGEQPLYMPWTMAPTGGDFASMTGETMLSYASSALPKKTKKEFDKTVKQFIPEWKGVDSPESVWQFRNSRDAVRKALMNELDVKFRDAGGLSIGEARLSVADPKQLMSRDGQIYNIGKIDPTRGIVESTHPSYPYGLLGEGIGQAKERVNIFQMLPDVTAARGIPDATAPRQTDLRALQMKPYGGIIDDKLLKALGL